MSETAEKNALLKTEEISAVIRAAFGNQAQVANCKQMHGGHYNTLYQIRTKNPDRHVVLRVAPRDDEAVGQYAKAVLMSERFKYDLLEAAGVPTSRAILADGTKTVIDRDYMLVDYIEATPLSDPSIPAEARPGIMREVGRLLARMHSITRVKYGKVMSDGSIKGSHKWFSFFGELLREVSEKCSTAGVFSEYEIASILDCYTKNREIFDSCGEPVFVHNDIWDPNILISKENNSWRVRAIIDTDNAFFAESEFEFVLWDNPDPDLQEGYGIALDQSAEAILRREFYRMHLYMNYAWFYLLMRPSPDFQAESKGIVLSILHSIESQI